MSRTCCCVADGDHLGARRYAPAPSGSPSKPPLLRRYSEVCVRLSHLAAALLMVTIWGFNFIVIRWGLNEVPPLTLTVMRFALAAFPAVLFVRRPQPSWRLVTALRLVCVCAAVRAVVRRNARRHANRPASLVIQVQAFFTIGLVAVLTHERAKPIQLIGATIAGAGLVLVAFHLPPSTRVGFLTCGRGRGVVGHCECDRQAYS